MNDKEVHTTAKKEALLRINCKTLVTFTTEENKDIIETDKVHNNRLKRYFQ